ncbi:MAG: glycerophosphodiester phosphodiesterase family protein [Chloroflexota bacterium]
MQALLNEFYEGRLATPGSLVFGHRGAKAYAPMNTLPSFELALVQGADGIELDVRLSRDGAMVIMHDDRVDATTDGAGRVSDLTLAEIQALDAGAWFGEAFRGARVPTLDEVFEAVGKRTRINVEIKAESIRGEGIEAQVAEAIRRHGLARSVIISSFNPLTLRRFRYVMPEVPIGYLYDQNTPPFVPHLMIGLAHEARNPHHSMVNASYMAWAEKNGLRVNTWTVNDPARALELRDLGVDCIITDMPDVILAALRD